MGVNNRAPVPEWTCGTLTLPDLDPRLPVTDLLFYSSEILCFSFCVEASVLDLWFLPFALQEHSCLGLCCTIPGRVMPGLRR